MIVNSNGKLLCEKWHDVIKNSLELSSGKRSGSTFLTPFGFELFRNSFEFKRRNLSRFYIYASTNQSIDVEKFENDFLLTLEGQIKEISPKLGGEIAVMAARSGAHITRRPAHYRTNRCDKLIVIEHRGIKIDLMSDHISYLLACVHWIPNFLIREMERFFTRRMARTRIFQIYLQLNALLSKIDNELLKLDKSDIDYITKRKAHFDFYFGHSDNELPTDRELLILKKIVSKLLNLQESKLFVSSEKIAISVKSYHSDVTHRFDFDRKAFRELRDWYQMRYDEFWGITSSDRSH